MVFRGRELQPKQTRRLALAATLVGILLGFLFLHNSLVAPDLNTLRETRVTAPDYSVVYVVTVDDLNNRGEIVILNERTGDIIKRVPTASQPDLAVATDGSRLYTLETKWSDDLKTPTHELSLIDTNDWRLLVRTTIQDRALYPSTGPSGLILAPDGSRLFLYSYRVLGEDYADSWIAEVDPITLKNLPTRIPLPNCDGAWFKTVQSKIVVLCSGSNDLRFVDIKTGRVLATVDIPRSGHVNPLSPEGKAVGFVVAEDQQAIYVVTNDLRFIEISPATQSVIREVTAWRQEPRSVPIDSVAISRDGDRLMVKTLSSPWDVDPLSTLRIFDVPSLTPGASVQLRGHAGFAAGPRGEVYVIAADGRTLNRFTPDLSQIGTLSKFEFLVHRIVGP